MAITIAKTLKASPKLLDHVCGLSVYIFCLAYPSDQWNAMIAKTVRDEWKAIENTVNENVEQGTDLSHILVGIGSHPRSKLYGGTTRDFK